jgi:hypothetical protein
MTATAGRELHLTIGSRFENIELVQAVVDDALREGGAAEDARHWIGLALREAVANAIKHGNRQDPGEQVPRQRPGDLLHAEVHGRSRIRIRPVGRYETAIAQAADSGRQYPPRTIGGVES